MGKYEQVLQGAQQHFLAGDFAQMAHAVGEPYDDALQRIGCVFLGQRYWVSCINATAAPQGHETPMPEAGLTVVLHHLITATGRQPTGKLVSFRDLPKGGMQYFPAFEKRSTQVLVRVLGSQPLRLLDALKSIPGQPAQLGDAAISVQALSRLSIILGLWGADDEFPASGQILFDETASNYLPLEDIAVVAGLVVYAVVEACR